MVFELSLLSGALVHKQSVNEVIKCNEITSRFGLVLTKPQALALVETRFFALEQTGRIEFGGGIIHKMIIEFCDSPYLSPHNYEETLHELLEIFYYYKNDTLDLISDNDLLKYMKKAFDGICQGSLQLLFGQELQKLSKNLKCKLPTIL